MGQSHGDNQIMDGFYELEGGSWRWTAGRFSVALQPPPGSAAAGARLELDFTVPEAVIARRKAVTLSAWVAGVPLAPATYAKPGDCLYRAEVPATALAMPPVKAAFALDRFLPAGEVDIRELGVVVRRVGLLPR